MECVNRNRANAVFKNRSCNDTDLVLLKGGDPVSEVEARNNYEDLLTYLQVTPQ